MTAPQKAFVREDGTTVVKCPSCGHARTVSVQRFKEKKKVIKVKCSCQKSYTVSLELRKMYRRSTNLKGSYINTSLNNEIGMMIVKDVSMGGIGFEAIGGNRIEKKHTLDVTFTLDDTHSSVIKKQVVVRIVSANFVGCEFIHAHEYNKALGFYLLP
ncbi:MAG: PilZ domain-containing protein [Thermodesulfobacteriota bacterium]